MRALRHTGSRRSQVLARPTPPEREFPLRPMRVTVLIDGPNPPNGAHGEAMLQRDGQGAEALATRSVEADRWLGIGVSLAAFAGTRTSRSPLRRARPRSGQRQGRARRSNPPARGASAPTFWVAVSVRIWLYGARFGSTCSEYILATAVPVAGQRPGGFVTL